MNLKGLSHFETNPYLYASNFSTQPDNHSLYDIIKFPLWHLFHYIPRLNLNILSPMGRAGGNCAF